MEDEKGTELVTQGGFQAIIEKVAALDNIDVDKLERMMQMQMQWEDRKEQEAFNDAVARVHAQLTKVRIIKTKGVSYDKGKTDAFKYTPIEDIDKVIRPLLDAEKIRVSYTQKPAENNLFETVCRLSRGRQFCESSSFMPVDMSGGKNAAQGMGSTRRYGERNALSAALNIITVGEDDDASGGPITDEQAAEIKTGLQETGLDTAKFLKTLKADNVEAIRTKDYARAMSAIDAKRWRNQLEKEKANAKVS